MARTFKRRNLRNAGGKRRGKFTKRKSLRARSAGSSKRPRKSNRRSGTGKIPRVRLSAPNTTVASTFYGNKLTPGMRAQNKRFKSCSRNMYCTGPAGRQLVAISGYQNWSQFDLFTKSTMVTALSAIGMAPTAGAGSLLDTNVLFWKTAERFTTLTNNTNATAFVDLYHYVCKRDTAYDIPSLWQTGEADEEGIPFQDDRSIIGNTPTLSNSVGVYWKLKKVWNIVLAPGQSHQHSHKTNMFKTVNNELLAGDIQASNYLAGISSSFLMVVKGSPCTDGTIGTLVNTAAMKVDIVTTLRYFFTYMSDNDTNLKIVSGTGMGTVGGPTNVVNTIGVAVPAISGATV